MRMLFFPPGLFVLLNALLATASASADEEPRLELTAHAGYANAGSHPVVTYAGFPEPFPTLWNGQVAPYRVASPGNSPPAGDSGPR